MQSANDALIGAHITDKLKAESKPFVVPLKFGNVDEELNFWCIVQLLNFGSGWRHELHASSGKVCSAHCRRRAQIGSLSNDG